MDSFSILVVVTSFLLAGFVKGVIGLGLPTVSLGLLSLVMTPAQAAAILLLPSFVTNGWQLTGPRFGVLIKRLWPVFAGTCLGALAGAGLLSNESGATVYLGAALTIYGALGLSAITFHVPPHVERWLAFPVGVATGLVTAATGVFVIPALPYFQALGLSRDDLVQTLGIHFTISTFALAAVLAINGVLENALASDFLVVATLAALLPALLGMYVGQRVRDRISAKVFRVCFFLGMIGLGAHLALRSMW